MKSPLRYQITECDCGCASILNAITYLYEREEIPPYLIFNIMKYTLDECTSNVDTFVGGTSIEALTFLSHWINRFAKSKNFNIKCELLSGNDATLDNFKIKETLESGGVLIPRVWSECEHYVIITKIDGDNVYIFDPYYDEEATEDEEIKIVNDKWEYNRIVKLSRLNSNTKKEFSLVNSKNKAIMLIRKKKE